MFYAVNMVPQAGTTYTQLYPGPDLGFVGCTPNTVANGCTGATTQAGAAISLDVLPVFNPQSYGAKWDGSMDDTAAINLAIAAACAAGGRVLFPAGIGIFDPATTNLTLCSGLEFDGQGIGVSTLRVKNGIGNYSTMFGSSYQVVTNVTLQNFTVDQNTMNNQPSSLSEGRVVIQTGQNAVGSLTIKNMQFLDLDSINTIISGNAYTTIQNSIFSLNTSGTLYHDHSTLYIAANHATVSETLSPEELTRLARKQPLKSTAAIRPSPAM